MPLNPLVQSILTLSHDHGSTPVIVTPRYLSLRSEFFVSLAETLVPNTPQSARIDWCDASGSARGMVREKMNQYRASRHNRALRAYDNLHVQLTATIARPGSVGRELVIGLCDESFDLPPWTTAIRLAGIAA